MMSRKKKRPASKPGQKSRNDGRRAAGGSNTSVEMHQRDSSGRRAEWARYLWAAITILVIGALLFEPTMLWCLSVGLWMVAEQEFFGLWLVVAGYVMACVPWAFGLLIAFGRFWKALTHALWIGLIYGALGYFFLDQILGLF